MRYRAEGGRDIAVYFGAATAIMAGWLAAAGIGYFLGSFLVDPARYGLDLVMPAFFAAMLVPLWAGARRAWGWVVAGIVAVAVERLVPGWWFIIAGSITGAVAGGYFEERDERRSGHIRRLDDHRRNGGGDICHPGGRILADGLCSADTAGPQHPQCSSGVGYCGDHFAACVARWDCSDRCSCGCTCCDGVAS
jgi:hypothetical protein